MTLAKTPAFRPLAVGIFPSLPGRSPVRLLSTGFPMKSQGVNNSGVIGFFSAILAPRIRRIPAILDRAVISCFINHWKREGSAQSADPVPFFCHAVRAA